MRCLVLIIALLVLAAPAYADRIQLLQEGFELTWPPAGWTTLSFPDSAGGPWTRTLFLNYSGFFAAENWHGEGDQWLVTGAVDLSGTRAPVLEFYQAGFATEADDVHQIHGQSHGPDRSRQFDVVASGTIRPVKTSAGSRRFRSICQPLRGSRRSGSPSGTWLPMPAPGGSMRSESSMPRTTMS